MFIANYLVCAIQSSPKFIYKKLAIAQAITPIKTVITHAGQSDVHVRSSEAIVHLYFQEVHYVEFEYRDELMNVWPEWTAIRNRKNEEMVGHNPHSFVCSARHETADGCKPALA